jgi:LysR family transcriptional regulator, transcriptional activator of the cysJI operon
MLQYSLISLMVFAAVARAKNFSKAAQGLFMTQPGVSTHIAHLEAQTGLKLIRRDRGGCALTKEGKVVYRYAEKVEKLAHALEDAAKMLRKDAAPFLRIGTPISYGKRIMPYLLGDFQRRNPGARIRLASCASAEMRKTLLAGENDVIIAANQHVSKTIRSFPFVREELVLIASKGHPLATGNAVSLSDIQPYPFIIREEGSMTRSVVLAAFSKMGVAPTVLIEANSTEFIKEWVSQGKGLSVLIRRAISVEEDPFLAAVPFQEPLFLEVAVLYLKSREYDPSVQRFVGYLKDLTVDSDLAVALARAAERRRASHVEPAVPAGGTAQRLPGSSFSTSAP